jgi:hypothetical protein
MLVGERLPQALEEIAHRGAPAVRGARREGGVDEVSQAAMVLAVDVEDVAAHLLEQRPLGHLEHLRDLHAGEGGGASAEEEGGGVAVEDEVADRRAGEPAALAQLGHRLVEARPLQLGREEVDLGQREVGDQGHRALFSMM